MVKNQLTIQKKSGLFREAAVERWNKFQNACTTFVISNPVLFSFSRSIYLSISPFFLDPSLPHIRLPLTLISFQRAKSYFVKLYK